MPPLPPSPLRLDLRVIEGSNTRTFHLTANKIAALISDIDISVVEVRGARQRCTPESSRNVRHFRR
jgi:hypothetical protein